ncbi:MAG TPA: caspase family protein, partial [Longimicrobiaceae bacterium]|nr:caspase family protein [Longimicrobiaceae bacterium]
TLRTGEYRDSYEVQAVPGQRLRVDASSSDFDTYLIVVDPRGQQRENDDAEGQPGHSVVEMEATESGAHRVVVTSYRRGETGAYTLSIDQGSAAGTAPAGRDVSALSLGGAPLSGRLAAGDRRLRNGEFSDGYVIDGREGQVLVVEMASRDFDTYLVVTTPDGQQVDNDDHEGSNRRSRVELPMRQSGRYRVIATSYRKGEVGAYTLTARAGGQEAPRVVQAARPGPTRVGGRTSSGLPPGTGNGGRVYGVFVGVSDYGGRAGNLPFTARDARTMRDAMVRGVGMQAGDAVVLTDRQATTAAVRQAVRSLAGRMGPDDILVFFHSGHGSRVPTRGTDDDDPDGMDETIEMYDAGIRDDELGEMLEEVRSGLVLVVIDACFSGGFSKDVINRPGRIGFFSSEEDVVSSVAAKFQAGGYLPVFVAEAVGDGRGDTEDEALSPRGDGRLSLLELSEYLRERYGTELRSDGSSGRASSRDEVVRRDISYQHLVVDRGGVDPYTVLFRW